MIKWIWYGNAAVLLAAILVLIIGLPHLLAREPRDSVLQEDPTGGKSSGPSTSSIGGDRQTKAESPLVKIARKYSERWKPPVGSVQVSLKPKEIVDTRARWRVDNSPWQVNNAIIENLPQGKHTISFYAVNDWIKPEDITVNVFRRKTSTAKGIYKIVECGSLKVIIEPPQVRDLQAQWQVDNDPWQESGATVSGVLAGKHTVRFKAVPDWNAPSPVSVNIAHEQTTEASGTYVVKPVGSLKVTLGPQPVLDAKAQWQLDNGTWQDSDAILNKIPTGLHQVRFNTIADWWTPDPVQVTIDQDQTAEASGTYTPKVYGSIRVNIGPPQVLEAGAQWRVDGKAWQASGDIDDKVLVGEPHSVEFKAVNGWDQVYPVNAEVAEDHITEVAAIYVESKPPAPTGLSIQGTFAYESKYLGQAWIKLATEKRAKLYFVGEKVGEYMIESITKGTVNFTRRGFKYALSVPKPKPGAVSNIPPRNVDEKKQEEPPDRPPTGRPGRIR